MSLEHDRELGSAGAHRADGNVVGHPAGETLVELPVDVGVEEPTEPHVIDPDANWHTHETR